MAALVTAILVVVLHMAFLAYMVVGGFLGLRRFALVWPHIGTTLYSVYVTVTSFTCPATTLEKWLLEASGRTPYEGSFTAHYLRDTLYPAQWETAIWLSCMGIAVLSQVLVFRRRRQVLRPEGAVAS